MCFIVAISEWRAQRAFIVFDMSVQGTRERTRLSLERGNGRIIVGSLPPLDASESLNPMLRALKNTENGFQMYFVVEFLLQRIEEGF